MLQLVRKHLPSSDIYCFLFLPLPELINMFQFLEKVLLRQKSHSVQKHERSPEHTQSHALINSFAGTNSVSLLEEDDILFQWVLLMYTQTS